MLTPAIFLSMSSLPASLVAMKRVMVLSHLIRSIMAVNNTGSDVGVTPASVAS